VKETRKSRLQQVSYAFEGVTFVDGTEVGVIHIDLPQTTSPRELPQPLMRFLEREHHGEVSIQWQFDIQLGNHAGKEIAYQRIDRQSSTDYSRWFLVGDRLYGLAWKSGYSQPSAKNLHEFWDSFRLLDEPDSTVSVIPTASTRKAR
jgi:hypothetical protein